MLLCCVGPANVWSVVVVGGLPINYRCLARNKGVHPQHNSTCLISQPCKLYHQLFGTDLILKANTKSSGVNVTYLINALLLDYPVPRSCWEGLVGWQSTIQVSWYRCGSVESCVCVVMLVPPHLGFYKVPLSPVWLTYDMLAEHWD